MAGLLPEAVVFGHAVVTELDAALAISLVGDIARAQHTTGLDYCFFMHLYSAPDDIVSAHEFGLVGPHCARIYRRGNGTVVEYYWG